MRIVFWLTILNIITAFKTPITVSDYIIKRLEKEGIKHIFGYPGGANLHLLDKVSKSKMNLIVSRHEQWSGHSAEGYAKASDKLSVCITTSGPGLTNVITPMQDCLSDGVPVLFISGQVSTSALGKDSFQECDAVSLTKACTKWNKLITSEKEIVSSLESAIKIAQESKYGPVHLDICSDVLSQLVVSEDEEVNTEEVKVEHNIVDYDKIAKLVNTARRPLIIAGVGSSKAYKEIRALSKKYNIPVTTTLHGLGIVDESEELSLKMLGMHGSAATNYAVQSADLILGIGNRFDDRTIGKKTEFGSCAKTIIHVDTNDKVKTPLEKLMSITADSLDFIVNLRKLLEPRKRSKWVSKIRNLKENFPFTYRKTDNLKVQDVIKEFSNKIQNKNYYVTTGVGNHQMMTAQYTTWNQPKRMITSGSLGTMGVGLPFAIGSYLATGCETYCIDGDGSFMMSLSELATIKNYNLPIKILLMNDNSLQMVKVWQELFYDKNYVGVSEANPEFTKLAESFGIKAIRCSNKDELSSTIEKIINTNSPILCEFIVEQDICLPFVLPSKRLDDMLINN